MDKYKDTTEKILNELEMMITEGVFTTDLENEIKELIQKVNKRQVNLFDYRRSDSKNKFGEELVMVISQAHERIK